MVKLNNFWLDSLKRKDIVKFIDVIYNGDYVNHQTLIDPVSGKAYVSIWFESAYSDNEHVYFDAYGYHNRKISHNNSKELTQRLLRPVIAWRNLMADSNKDLVFDGKTYIQSLEEYCDIEKTCELSR